MYLETMSPRVLTLIALATAVLAGVFMTAVSPATATAQSPAICEQYPNLPQCQEDESDDDDDEHGIPGPSAGGGSAAAGELPFTGYPLNPLILLFLSLLALGLATRSYLAIRERLGLRTRESHDSYP